MPQLLKWKNRRLIPVQNTELTDLPGEKWKTIPDFPAYQLSSHGRVKSVGRAIHHSNGRIVMRPPRIIKLRILKIDKGARFSIVTMGLWKDRKIYSFSVARYVYHLFVKPFDLDNKSILIVKKDGNPLNCHYKNLRPEIPKNSTKHIIDKIKAAQRKKKEIAVLNDDVNSLPDEEWKLIPGFDDKYMLSGFGRLKSVQRLVEYRNGKVVLHKEKINKAAIIPLQGRPGKFKIDILLMKDGYGHRFTLPRLVYYHFVKPFDLENKSLLVTFKDGNDLNCHYKNLELKTGSKIKADLFEKNGTEKYFRKIQKAVHQYNSNGNWLASYDSIAKASDATGISVTRISNAIHRRQLQDKTYYWLNGEKPKKLDLSVYKEKSEKYFESVRRPVEQLSMEGRLLKTYNSISEATKAMGLASVNSIAQVCKGLTKTCQGYRWQYKEKLQRSPIKNNVGQPVYRYSLSGEFLGAFPSVSAAAAAVGIVPSAIGNAIRLRHKTAKGSYWRRGRKELKINTSIYADKRQQHRDSSKKSVQKYTLSGRLVKTYESLVQAANDMKISPGAIKNACQAENLICKGYHWKFVKK